jgi:hypothetical protein
MKSTFFRTERILVRGLSIILLGLAFSSCHKDPVQVPDSTTAHMKYVDFHDLELPFGKGLSIDLDEDGLKDIFFSSILVGDPLEQADKRQFIFGTSPTTFSPVDDNEETPALTAGRLISATSFPGHHWYNANVILAQKIIKENIPDTWFGNWKDKSHQYIVVRVDQQSEPHYGWLELSFDIPGEKIVLHRAGLCKEAGREINAGE